MDISEQRSQNADSKEPQRSPRKRARVSDKGAVDFKISDQHALIQSLLRLDPILQFLTKATGKPLVPLDMLLGAIPGSPSMSQQILESIPEIAQRGILQLDGEMSKATVTGADVKIGFPSPPSMELSPELQQNSKAVGNLHASTKSAAKRRLAALKRSLKESPGALCLAAGTTVNIVEENSAPYNPELESPPRNYVVSYQENEFDSGHEGECAVSEIEKEARHALHDMFHFKLVNQNKSRDIDSRGLTVQHVLPKQAAYAGSNLHRTAVYCTLSSEILANVPATLLEAFNLERHGNSESIFRNQRKLYKHQAAAIESAVKDIHTLVCTGTGSGKSLCFLIPVMAAAMTNRETSLLLFPTKALAQDQMSKLTDMIAENPKLRDKVKPGIIDGDVSHPDRSSIAKNCNIILTNPDTLHAAILPGWKAIYKNLLGTIKYIVIDEAHMYDGVFGAHIAMVLARLVRICAVCTRSSSKSRMPTFIACSATMSNPEQHFRMICPIALSSPVTILTQNDDGSPRASKHFFVWNPPIMSANGVSTGRVMAPNSKSKICEVVENKNVDIANSSLQNFQEVDGIVLLGERGIDYTEAKHSTITGNSSNGEMQFQRRHSADETALLLARAVANSVRCIAFCKTRSLVEWVYERTIQALNSDPATVALVKKVESYRGGYTVETRRMIEERLFNGELTGVVGTSALELGVDIGGIDLTLHCGYPTSFASLLQQAGRAGRGAGKLHVPSLAVIVSFNSPSEQHLWSYPRNLLSRGLSFPISIPINASLVREHLLCAGAEYPLTGKFPVTILFETIRNKDSIIALTDYELFGSQAVFMEAIASLKSTGLMKEVSQQTASGNIVTFKTHPFVERPWSKVSLRSIEPVNYKIVNLSHPLQGSQMDGIKDERVVMDIIPYSRVFYHAFPGAIIMHRGRKYKVQSMTRPPTFVECCNGYRCGANNLAAYAKPTNARYSTRPLASTKITVIKQLERLDYEDIPVPFSLNDKDKQSAKKLPEQDELLRSLGGNGVVSICRRVTGFQKLSSVTRVEISRHELSMPPMEWDTFAFWLDTEAMALRSRVEDYDAGIHALSHALLAVAPLFVPCTSSEINCDHSSYQSQSSRILIFDVRAGGAGTTALLWKCLFRPSGLLQAAIDILTNCPSCQRNRESTDYDGGCPACIQSGQCLNFNQHLSRSAAGIIGRRLLSRIQKTRLYNKCALSQEEETNNSEQSRLLSKQHVESPRRAARAKALHDAKDLRSARERHVVVGRPTWPLDYSDGVGGRQEDAD